MCVSRGRFLTIAGLIVIIGVVICLGDVKAGDSTPHSSLARLLPINYDKELARWQNAPLSMKESRYAPDAVRRSLSPKDLRQRAARFIAYAQARKAVLQGTASHATTLTYYNELIHDLEERIAAIEYLQPQRMLSSSSRDVLMRGSMNLDELARLKKLLIEYKAISVLHKSSKRRRLIRPKSTPRDRVICFVDATGIVYCALEDRLIDRAIAGYWNNGVWETLHFNEAHAYNILRRIDEISARHDLDVTNNTFIVCANGGWWSADTWGPHIGSPKGLTPKELPSLAEMQQMAAACRDLSPISGGVQTAGGITGGLDSRSQMATETIKRIDERVNNCKEGPQGLVSAGPSGFDFFKPDVLDVLEAIMNTPHPGPDLKKEEEARQREELRRESVENERAIDLLNEAAEKLEKDADQLEKQADEENNAEKEAEAAQKRKQAEALRKESNCRAASGKSCAEVEADKKKAQKEKPPETPDDQPQETGDTRGELDGVNYSNCASLKAAWERFKEECERTGGWDRPGSECNEFVRRENGCVSTTVINPNPEGDRTCIRVSVSEAELYKKGCEERQKVMSSAEMLDGNCNFLDRHQFETSWTDVCNNPAAMPREDVSCVKPGQSSGFPGAPTGGQRKPIPPRPYGDFFTTKSGIVFDALRLEGLGFTVPMNVPGITMP